MYVCIYIYIYIYISTWKGSSVMRGSVSRHSMNSCLKVWALQHSVILAERGSTEIHTMIDSTEIHTMIDPVALGYFLAALRSINCGNLSMLGGL